MRNITSHTNSETPRLRPPGEAELAAAAQAGDVASLEVLLSRYERKIFRLAQNITRNRDDAEEVMQETFLKCVRHFGSFQRNSGFYTWLVRIAINESFMKLRKRRPNVVSLDAPHEGADEPLPLYDPKDSRPTPEEQVLGKELQGILAEAIAELKPSVRMVFQLRVIEKFSTKETATLLGLSVPAVKTRLLRAHTKLREKLSPRFQQDAGHYARASAANYLFA